MATLTEMVATVVVHSSAAALSHFGVTLETCTAPASPPPVERVVARSPRPAEHLVSGAKLHPRTLELRA